MERCRVGRVSGSGEGGRGAGEDYMKESQENCAILLDVFLLVFSGFVFLSKMRCLVLNKFSHY